PKSATFASKISATLRPLHEDERKARPVQVQLRVHLRQRSRSPRTTRLSHLNRPELRLKLKRPIGNPGHAVKHKLSRERAHTPLNCFRRRILRRIPLLPAVRFHRLYGNRNRLRQKLIRKQRRIVQPVHAAKLINRRVRHSETSLQATRGRGRPTYSRE